MMKIDNKDKIAELVNIIGDGNSIIAFDKDVLVKLREKNTILYGSYLSNPSENTSPMLSVLNQLKEANVEDLKKYSLCTFSIHCHNADIMTMDDLAKVQTFLSEYINPEAEVIWEYRIDDGLKLNQMRLTLVLG